MIIDIDHCKPLRLRMWDVPITQPIILYVERNHLLRPLLRDVFDLAGWHSQEAFDASTAEEMLRGRQRFSVLLTADELPSLLKREGQKSGLELVKVVRALPHRKELPILFCSIEDCAERAKEAGATAFLRKPHDLFLLVDTMRELLAAVGYQKR